MATASENRRKKAQKKHKQRRSAAKQKRAARQAHVKCTPAQAAHWPVREALLSEGWLEEGSTVRAVLVRAHADGTFAYASFSVDQAQNGLSEAEVEVGVAEGVVQNHLMANSEDSALVYTAPEAVACLVMEGLAFRRAAGLTDPPELERALALLGDLDPSLSPYDFQFGDASEDAITEEIPGPGFGARFSSWFRRST